MRIAYVRVSSQEQNEARQVEALKAYDIDKWYIDKVSGKNTDRPHLKELRSFVRERDTLYVESISRLARSTMDFLTLVGEFENKGVAVVFLKEGMDSHTPQGRFMLTVFGALYELERENIRERQSEGIAVARKRGVKFGRPRIEIDSVFLSAYSQWREGKVTAADAMNRCGMKPNTWYRRVKEHERCR